MNSHENTTISIVSFLEVAKQPQNLQLLKKIGLNDLAQRLEIDWNNHLSVQKARYELLVNMELVKNRCAIRFKLARKRVDDVRRMLRSHCRDREDLQKALHIHPSNTPKTCNPKEQFGYWNKLLNSYHLLTDGAFPGISLNERERERCNAMEVAIQFYDAEDVSLTLHRLDSITAKEYVARTRARMEETFQAIEAGMKNTVLAGQAAWPMLEALFFPQRRTRVIQNIMTEAIRHAC